MTFHANFGLGKQLNKGKGISFSARPQMCHLGLKTKNDAERLLFLGAGDNGGEGAYGQSSVCVQWAPRRHHLWDRLTASPGQQTHGFKPIENLWTSPDQLFVESMDPQPRNLGAAGYHALESERPQTSW
ncbi:hypothetical protein CEXT_175321 [Caerostris extrusa]|uniref:Uncharacterized protein n=1 Tax=Caerostris extrusa TaxID=172846 RepID=A0AAV4YFL0_CAEEX|nr:hypothetical protein CEXT_175321 [Caerostris extrusa]